MFSNANKKVVRNLAKSSLRTDKLNSLFLLLTILVSTCMIFSIFLITKGNDQLHKNTQVGKAQIALIGTSEKQIDELEQLSNIEWYSESVVLGYSYQDNITLNVLYEDDKQIEQQNKYNYVGKTPVDIDEIMVSNGYLDYLGVNKNVGESISLDLTGEGKIENYYIAGIIDYTSKNENYQVWVSKKLAKKLSNESDLLVTAYVRLKTNAIVSNDILSFAKNTFEGTSIPREQIMLTEYFSVMSGNNRQGGSVSLWLFGSIILFLASLVIYCIFYTSVIKDVRSYGQLRTIGFTKKQVKKMVYKKGLYLSLKGIPIGVILGLIIGFAACPAGFIIKNAIIGAIIISILMLLAIKISLRVPVKLAANISPIESSKYLSYTGKSDKKRSYRLSPFRLSIMNLGRNKKKTTLTVIMLGLSSAILVFTSILAGSLDAEKKAQFSYFPDGQLQISIQRIAKSTFDKSENEEFRGARLQLENNPLIDEELLQSLRDIDGVKEVTEHKAMYFSTTKSSGGKIISMNAQDAPIVNEDEYSNLKDYLIQSPDYDTLVSKKGIIAREDWASIGEECILRGRSKNGDAFDIKVPVVGTYYPSKLMENLPLVPGTPNFIIASDTVYELTGIKNQTGIISIEVDASKLDKVTNEIKKISNKNDTIDLNTLEQITSGIQRRYDSRSQMLYIIAVILFIFGIVSLANVILSNIAVRQKELGLLQAIGVTNKQIVKMLNYENAVYTIVTSLVGVSCGTIAGIIFCIKLNAQEHCITFNYPWIVIFLLFFIVIIVQIVISLYTKKSLRKSTVIDRIRASI